MAKVITEGKDKPKRYMVYEDGDELLKRAQDVADEYDAARDKENEGKLQKEAARDHLIAILGTLAVTSGEDPDRIDGIVTKTGFMGWNQNRTRQVEKRRIFRKTESKRKTLSAEKLLALGVSANVISKAYDETTIVSWTVADVNDDGNL